MTLDIERIEVKKDVKDATNEWNQKVHQCRKYYRLRKPAVIEVPSVPEAPSRCKVPEVQEFGPFSKPKFIARQKKQRFIETRTSKLRNSVTTNIEEDGDDYTPAGITDGARVPSSPSSVKSMICAKPPWYFSQLTRPRCPG